MTTNPIPPSFAVDHIKTAIKALESAKRLAEEDQDTAAVLIGTARERLRQARAILRQYSDQRSKRIGRNGRS